MTFDDIDYPYDGHAYVWVKPAEGKVWEDITNSNYLTDRGNEHRPAKLSGTPPEDEYRGTQLDGRRIWLLGSQYGYRLENFELGGEMKFEEAPALKM